MRDAADVYCVVGVVNAAELHHASNMDRTYVLASADSVWESGSMEPTVRGIGYEGQDVVSFARELKRLSVRTVVDVRLTPVSRKKGFSKRGLATQLATAGVGYVHMAVLGNPQWNRAGFSASPAERAQAQRTCRELYGRDEAVFALDEICALAAHGPVALLCFEADEDRCHRAVVLDAVRERIGLLACAV
jgi:uncharacterized protein (DUF488 family)